MESCGDWRRIAMPPILLDPWRRFVRDEGTDLGEAPVERARCRAVVSWKKRRARHDPSAGRRHYRAKARVVGRLVGIPRFVVRRVQSIVVSLATLAVPSQLRRMPGTGGPVDDPGEIAEEQQVDDVAR